MTRIRVEPPEAPALSPARRRLLATLVLFGTWWVIELGSLVAFRVATGEAFSFAAMSERRQALAEVTPEAQREFGDAAGSWTFEGSGLHPYLGYTRESAPEHRLNFGFRRTPSSPGGGEPIRIGVVGGSVAEDLFRYFVNSAEWPQLLRTVPGLEQAQFEHVLLGLRGYKQPQQLQAVAYYLALGGQLDILIQLDGYNEVVLSAILQEAGTFAAYPFHWRAFTNHQPSPAQLLLLGEIEQTKALRHRLARVGERLRFSAVASIGWHLADRFVAGRLAARRAALEAQDAATESYFRSGPVEALQDRDVATFMTAVWARSSRQIAALAKENGFRYYHFLQPNQYVPGSKPLSALELQESYTEDSPTTTFARRGYPLLIAAGRELALERGVYRDLTQIFRDVHDTVYRDACCHLNRLGNSLLAREIAATLRELDPALRQRGPHP